MESSEYARMEKLERHHWWHVGRLEILRRELARRTTPGQRRSLSILNVGCGTGGTIAMLEAFGVVRNVDVSDDAIAFARANGFEVDKVESHRLHYPDGTFDVVTALDVLEHIENDTAALSEWTRVLRPGGFVLLTVPAYPWLWSDHDEALHHHRRYVRRRMMQLCAQAGLHPVRVSYAIVGSLPLVVGFRLLNRVRGAEGDGRSSYVDTPEWVNRALVRVLHLEARLHGVVRFPAGSSLLAVLAKPPSALPGPRAAQETSNDSRAEHMGRR